MADLLTSEILLRLYSTADKWRASNLFPQAFTDYDALPQSSKDAIEKRFCIRSSFRIMDTTGKLSQLLAIAKAGLKYWAPTLIKNHDASDKETINDKESRCIINYQEDIV